MLASNCFDEQKQGPDLFGRQSSEAKVTANSIGTLSIGCEGLATNIQNDLEKIYGVEGVGLRYIELDSFFDFHWRNNML